MEIERLEVIACADEPGTWDLEVWGDEEASNLTALNLYPDELMGYLRKAFPALAEVE